MERKQYGQEENLFERVQTILDGVRDVTDEFEAKSKIPTDFLSDEHIDDLPHSTSFRELRTTLDKLAAALAEAVASSRKAYTDADSVVADVFSKWNVDFNSQQESYKAILRDLQSETLDPDDYIQTEKEIGKIEPLVTSAGSVDTQRKELLDERERILNELNNNRREQFRARQVAERFVNDRLAGLLEVEMNYEGQKDAFIESVVRLKTGARKEQLQKVVDHDDFSPRRFAKALAEGPATLASAFSMTSTAAQTLCSKIDRQTAFELETTAIPSSISIRLNIGTKENANFRETDRLSVGQRCTAILMLILLHSRYPLIVDQPEDDLDNSFIYTDIVRRLRVEKEKRQFIIATHNANIPVLGDAELIQVLSAERGKMLLDECIAGSIDDEAIRAPVETILEGGREAFELRQAKYGF